MMKRHVALVGFMGSGKSTIGRKLARRLGCAFFDTDDEVARAHGAVAAIFATQGEAAFRRYERDAISGILDNGPSGVVALGGGALTVAANRRLLEERAYRVFIRVSPQQVLARVRRSREERPLLGAAPTLARVKELYDRRLEQYSSADYVVEAERRSGRDVVDEIVRWIRRQKIEIGTQA